MILTILTYWLIAAVVLTAFLCRFFAVCNARAEREEGEGQRTAKGLGVGGVDQFHAEPNCSFRERKHGA